MAKITLVEEGSTPAAPAAGSISIYAKTDDLMYYIDSSGTEQLITAGSAITALTGDITAAGPGSAAATIATDAVTNAKMANMPAYSVKSNNTGSIDNPSDNQDLILGTPNYVASGIAAQITGSETTYFQAAVQNTSANVSASADFVVANDLGTDVSHYGDFGINASTAIPSGAFDRPNETYLYAQSGDLAIGTYGANDIHIAANNSSTDAIKINSSNGVILPAHTGYLKGTGSSPITSSSTIPVGDISGTLPIANGGTNSSTALSNNRVMRSSSGTIVEAAAITASRALISDANGIPTHSATTSTELGYVAGVTSAIQTQIDGKASAFGLVSVSGDVTLTPNSVHLVSSAAARNLTLPAHVAGQRLYIKDITGSCGTNNFTLIRTGGGNIDGLAASRTLQTDWGSWHLVDNGTDWFFI